MGTVSIERMRAEDLTSEFIPPLNMPDAHGLSWDRQLDVAAAWQEAGGNIDGGADAVFGIVDSPLPTMRTITRMNTVLIGLGQRLQQIQLEAANVAIGEMAHREGSAPKTLNPEDAFSPLHSDNLKRVEALATSCLDLLSTARLNLTGIPGFLPSGQSAMQVERRQRAVLIDFPDRRAAA